MKYSSILTFALLLGAFPAAGEVLFSDTFDAANTSNLNESEQLDRRAGLNPAIQVRSSRRQHGIVDNELNFRAPNTGGSARIRFHDDPDDDVETAGDWYNWASGATGAAILRDGGIVIEFDWISGDIATHEWLSLSLGGTGEAIAQPSIRVNDPDTDVSLLFNFDGGTSIFNSGLNISKDGLFTATEESSHVVITYLFDSFADGTPVRMNASIDGVDVFNHDTFMGEGDDFMWEGNEGELYIEMGTRVTTQLDNLSISTPAMSTPTVLTITDVSYDDLTPSISITFNSKIGETYALDFSTTLTAEGEPGGWLELDDSLVGEGTSTTVVDAFTPGSGVSTAFYRIRIR